MGFHTGIADISKLSYAAVVSHLTPLGCILRAQSHYLITRPHIALELEKKKWKWIPDLQGLDINKENCQMGCKHKRHQASYIQLFTQINKISYKQG